MRELFSVKVGVVRTRAKNVYVRKKYILKKRSLNRIILFLFLEPWSPKETQNSKEVMNTTMAKVTKKTQNKQTEEEPLKTEPIKTLCLF